MIRIWMGILLASGLVFSAPDLMPAARQHVKIEGGQAVKYRSRLAKVVELNFTLGNTHQPGKIVIRNALDRIARNYGLNGADAFAVQHISSALDGSMTGEVPDFTVNDLLSGQVIVANNISRFDEPGLGNEKREAIRQAIEVGGRGYLAFHGTAECFDRARWPWLHETLFPWEFLGHMSRVSVPIYKHATEARHMILEGVLEQNVKPMRLQDEPDVDGNPVWLDDVPARRVKYEPFRFGRDISREPAFREKFTLLLKLNPDSIHPGYFPRRLGGNIYSYLLRVGNGMTSFLPAGHENDELLAPATGFDGDVGDFDRYVAQMLFFLAGYQTAPCDSTCRGLPIVDENQRLTGQIYGTTAIFHPRRPAFIPVSGPYRATLLDLRGRVLSRKDGAGNSPVDFREAALKPGLYFLRVRGETGPAQVKRVAVTPGPE